MKNKPSIDVIIPIYKPTPSFSRLLNRLETQSVRPDHILVINTEERFFDPSLTAGFNTVEVFHIPKNEFDHGGTRDMGAGFSAADYLMFMTQDAMPADEHLIEKLIEPFADSGVKAAYARQIPNSECEVIEGFSRSFNYPKESCVKSSQDLPGLGIKTYFCSNVCAMYDHAFYRDIGGFTRPCIFNEDLIFGGRLIMLGYKIAYASDAKVFHSHNYSNSEQFHRYFDNGVSQAMHPEIFKGVPSEHEGMKLVKKTARCLRKIKCGYLIPQLYVQNAAKLAGFRLGKMYAHLPKAFVRACSLNKEFWDDKNIED